MVIFHSYVSLPEGNLDITIYTGVLGSWKDWKADGYFLRKPPRSPTRAFCRMTFQPMGEDGLSRVSGCCTVLSFQVAPSHVPWRRWILAMFGVTIPPERPGIHRIKNWDSDDSLTMDFPGFLPQTSWALVSPRQLPSDPCSTQTRRTPASFWRPWCRGVTCPRSRTWRISLGSLVWVRGWGNLWQSNWNSW